jgi:prevent-host-death family protein
MEAFSSLDLQQRTGDVQQASAHAPVLLTSHSKPRNVMMSVEEYRRLKAAAGEPIPPEVQERGGTVRKRVDPLGYDMSDYGAAIDKMVADVRSGRTQAAVAAELAAVRRAYKGGGQ